MPKRQECKTRDPQAGIANRVRAASIQWATAQLQKFHPELRHPGSIAKEIVAIAEKHKLPIEDTIRWIEHANNTARVSDFARWAAAYAATEERR